MSKEKLAFIDVETSGLSASKNFVHQIAIIIVIDGEVKERVSYKIKPPRGTIINKYALAVSNTTMDMLESYPHHTDVYKEFIELLSKHVDKFDKTDKFHFCGYNAAFDNRFVRAFFDANNDNFFGSWFWSSNIDVMAIAAMKLRSERSKMKNFKLGTVVEYLEVSIPSTGELHDAMYDIEITYELYKKLNNGK